MMNNIFRKRLVIGIIILFFGAGIVPSISSNINKINQVENMNSADSMNFLLANGLVGYWNFNEGNGNIVYDGSGKGNDGTIYNASWALGISGSALRFDGDQNHVLVSDDESLNLSNAMTIGAWIKSNDTTGPRTIVSKWKDYTQNHSFIFKDHNDYDTLRIQLCTGYHYDHADVKGNTSIVLENWIYIATTFDSNTLKLYYNGKEDGSVKAIITISKSIADVIIGGTNLGEDGRITEGFHGLIDEVRIYNRALSKDEIQYLYDHPSGENNPPETPSITGPSSGIVGQDYNFTIMTTDLDEDDLYYYINWDDNSGEEVIGPYVSGEEITISHNWTERGTYLIQVKAKDTYGAESDWETFEVTIPRTRASMSSLFLSLVERFPILQQFINRVG